ncbi:MAG TPA: hypothetical protein VIU14_01125 [Mesorhizobium sp.]|jgi:hypothetical protein
MPSPPKRNEEKAESRRILGRVSRDTDLAAHSAQRHVHRDEPDPIEQLGIRIGKAISLFVTIAIIAWGVLWLIRNSS